MPRRSRIRALPDTPQRAVGMIRVSKVGARDQSELLSPTLQRTAIEDYAAQRGMVVVEWVEAVDESGSSRRSPWWQRLDTVVEQIEAGERDAVLVWKFSRAARWRRAWAVALDRIEQAGGVLESATEQLDTRTSTGRLARGMLAELSAWEAEVKGEQWKETHADRRRRGLPHTAHPQLGYQYQRGEEEGYRVDPDQAEWVRAAYERFAQGDSFRSIAHWLNRTGRRTTRGGEFDPSNLARWMDGGFPAGLLPSDDGPSRGAHEPIVDDRLWASYQRKRTTTRRQPAWVRSPVHPLAGLVVCGRCGGTMQRASTTSRGRAPQRIFVCRAAVRRGTCPGVRVYEARVHDVVRAWLAGLADDVDVRARALAEQKATAATARQDRKRLAREITRLDATLARLTVQVAEGLVPPAAYAAARDDLEAQRRALVEQLVLAEDRHAAVQRPAPRVARGLLDSWDTLTARDPAGLRDVLAALIGRVEVHPGEGRGHRSTVRVVARWETTEPPHPGEG